MPEIITSDSFTMSDFKGLNLRKEVQELVRAALTLGWTASKSQRGLTLKPYLSTGSNIYLSKSPRNNSGPLRQMREKIIRYGDPLRFALISNPGGDDGPHNVEIRTTPSAEEWLATQEPAFAIALRSFDPDDIRAALKSARANGMTFPSPDESLTFVQAWVEERNKIRAEISAESTYVELPPAVQEESVVPETVEDRKIVSVRPFKAHARKGTADKPGKSYESGSVLERVWSDDTKDYQCAVKGCDYSASNAFSINSHRKKHTNKGEVPIVGSWVGAGLSTLVDDPSYTEYVMGPRERELQDEYSPREDRVSALAAALLEAMTGHHNETPAEIADRLARKALGWVHAQQGSGSPHAPQTAEEVLEAVRSLVDRGEYARLRSDAETAEQAAAEAREKAQRAQEAVEKAQRRAAKWKGELSTLKDLMSSVGSDDDED